MSTYILTIEVAVVAEDILQAIKIGEKISEENNGNLKNIVEI
jgi:hypothetical protein